GRDGYLVLQSAEALAFPQHRQHVKYWRRGDAAGERRPQRLRYTAKLEPLAFGERAYRLLGGLGAPGLDCREFLGQIAEQCPRLGGEQARRLVVERERAIGEDEARAIQEFD